MNCCVVVLSLFSSVILTWSADSLYSVQWHIKYGEWAYVQTNMHTTSTNFAKMLVWKHEYVFKLWRHKQRTPNTNDQHMPLNETSHENFLLMLLQFCSSECTKFCNTHRQIYRGRNSTIMIRFCETVPCNVNLQIDPRCANYFQSCKCSGSITENRRW